MIKFLLVGVIVMLMYRFWDTSQKKIDNPDNDQEPDQYTDYEEID
jgi:hypothetical protein